VWKKNTKKSESLSKLPPSPAVFRVSGSGQPSPGLSGFTV
jgi:hypothetical protein